jgi:hypothetical protein
MLLLKERKLVEQPFDERLHDITVLISVISKKRFIAISPLIDVPIFRNKMDVLIIVIQVVD